MPWLRELIGRVKLSDTNAPETRWQGDLSVLRDFWCYSHRPTGSRLSVLRQTRLLRQKHIHLNLIRVGDELLEDDRQRRINGAAHRLREAFARVNLGVIRLQHYTISTEQANGREIIDSDSEADALTNEWTVHNEGLDIFLVQHGWEEAADEIRAGLSSVDGSCDKDDGKGMTGSLVSITDDVDGVGQTMAHEVGHYLGLRHRPDKKASELKEEDLVHARNLMFPTSLLDNFDIEDDQAQTIKEHCFVLPGN